MLSGLFRTDCLRQSRHLQVNQTQSSQIKVKNDPTQNLRPSFANTFCSIPFVPRLSRLSAAFRAFPWIKKFLEPPLRSVDPNHFEVKKWLATARNHAVVSEENEESVSLRFFVWRDSPVQNPRSSEAIPIVPAVRTTQDSSTVPLSQDETR